MKLNYLKTMVISKGSIWKSYMIKVLLLKIEAKYFPSLENLRIQTYEK